MDGVLEIKKKTLGLERGRGCPFDMFLINAGAMSTAWSFQFPYRGGDDVHVRRLPRAAPPAPHAVAADALFGLR